MDSIEYNGRMIEIEFDHTVIDGLSNTAQDLILALGVKDPAFSENDLPDEAVAAGWCVVKMQEIIERLDRKVDDIIDENMEMRKELKEVQKAYDELKDRLTTTTETGQ